MAYGLKASSCHPLKGKVVGLRNEPVVTRHVAQLLTQLRQ